MSRNGMCRSRICHPVEFSQVSRPTTIGFPLPPSLPKWLRRLAVATEATTTSPAPVHNSGCA